VGGYDDCPELYTRWFDFAAFLPIFRSHGGRKYHEVWSYGKAAALILEKYLKLRYQLLPYIYSLGSRCMRLARVTCARCSWIFRTNRAWPICATSTCSVRRFWWLR